jgi:adenylate cyclase
MERRLVAILAADVVGYSRLMGVDETGVLEALKALRADLFDPLIESHNGRIVKLMGDGVLVEFTSVVDAVTCADAIQRQVTDRNERLPQERRLELRIGINVGDVILEGDDLYGDGVNVAARLEAVAEPGGICVSQAVVDHASGKAPVGFFDMGELRLKNIDRPVHVYRVDPPGRDSALQKPARRRILLVVAVVALLLTGIAGWHFMRDLGSEVRPAFDRAAALAIPTGPTIAVLPFENLSGDPNQDYLSDGISEDIVVELGRFRDLNVLSRQSTSVYRGRAVDVRHIGEVLGADYVLEGSVRRVSDRLRVTARLVDANSGAQSWTDAFDEVLGAANLFDVQLRITEQVASAVGASDGAIKGIDARQARAKPPVKLSSYECSMLRVAFYDRPDLQKRVRGCILRVVVAEPDYWRGWAQLSESLVTDVKRFSKLYDGTHAEKFERALDAARNAVSLNSEAPRAHFALAHALLMTGDRDGFSVAAEAALALGGDRHIEGELGYYFVWSGGDDFGAALLRRVIDLNPKATQPNWRQALAAYHFNRGEYEEALIEFRKGPRPRYWWTVMFEVAILTRLGRIDEARTARDRLYVLRPDVEIADIVWVYRRFQRPDAIIAKYVAALKEAGIPEGRYRPLDLDQSG